MKKNKEKDKNEKQPSTIVTTSMLHEAVRANRKDVVEDILRRNASSELINSFDAFGQAPLHIAASNGFKEITEILIGFGADLNVADKNSWTPLHRSPPPNNKPDCKHPSSF